MVQASSSSVTLLTGKGRAVRVPLQPDEALLWSGRPADHLRKFPGCLLVTLILAAVALVSLLASGLGGAFIPLLFAGAMGVVVHLRAAEDRRMRRSTAYALTTRRAIRLTGEGKCAVDVVDLSNLTEVRAIEHGDRIGTVYTVPTGAGIWPKRNRHGRPRALFRQILEPDRVRTMLLDAQMKLPPPSSFGRRGRLP